MDANFGEVNSSGNQYPPSIASSLRSAFVSRRYSSSTNPTNDFMWIDRNGRPVSPPSNHPRSPTFRKASMRHTKQPRDIRESRAFFAKAITVAFYTGGDVV
ncbi:hypothetical protein JTE90_027915 [Oedothorax gibbosus]|uniref:Uncharacterized protein n=1 Tax=Oedothorax gibbosus TaxID=931172 RepID=A0AAV6U8M3_9ARAC|nr:hypothetical protein JTE90_027915 [Oedothorax gibbosus]